MWDLLGQMIYFSHKSRTQPYPIASKAYQQQQLRNDNKKKKEENIEAFIWATFNPARLLTDK